MKKFLISVICAILALPAFAAGENVATSKAFVDTAVAQKQDKIPANSGTTQVLTNTGTAGNVGTKNVYDSTATYSDQTDALVDAATMNTAVQNAINAEFKCVQYNPNDSNDCWLVDIFGSTGKSTLPTGYTALEYIKSTGAQRIDTEIIPSDDLFIEVRFKDIELDHSSIQYGRNYIMGVTNIGYARAQFSISNTDAFFGWGQAYETNVPISIIPGKIYTMKADKTAFKLNNQVIYTPTSHKFSGSDTIMLFGLKDGPYFVYSRNLMIYYSHIYREDVLIQNLIPARRDNDGEIGMYDTVTNTFFTNSGTGDFIAGPIQNLYLPSGN